jgi:hypothetical protein
MATTSFNWQRTHTPRTSVGRKLFPVVYSTLDAHALAALAFSNYPIDVSKSCQFWHRGLSDVYLLETLDNPSQSPPLAQSNRRRF